LHVVTYIDFTQGVLWLGRVFFLFSTGFERVWLVVGNPGFQKEAWDRRIGGGPLKVTVFDPLLDTTLLSVLRRAIP
jgi:hypothetical protein